MKKWHKNKWRDIGAARRNETAAALTAVAENLNQGQRQKLMKNEEVSALFLHYGVALNE